MNGRKMKNLRYYDYKKCFKNKYLSNFYFYLHNKFIKSQFFPPSKINNITF